MNNWLIFLILLIILSCSAHIGDEMSHNNAYDKYWSQFSRSMQITRYENMLSTISKKYY